ncbi:hypothetical protein [Ruegeria meonggei]|uniref:Uncharacterized protein n=1 Tax=Ruegeria meonggei TaxID=1446476 RepID=A0A1X6ZEX5_9RHOB|nr:hypothetical protein [Ruegeria meonggei]SLN49355.1 hypothetical protein RUM8411_02310 [Ruegeria meonggei]
MNKTIVILVFVMANLLASDFVSAQTFNGYRIGDWGLFEDGDYCWMATRLQSKSNRAITLAFDSDGDPAILLEPGASEKFHTWDSIVLRAGKDEFEFIYNEQWARPASKADHDKVLSAILTQSRLLFEASGTNSKRTRKFEGHFKTKRADKAVAALKKRCDWRAD